MASGISIGIAADTRPFASAVKSGVVEPLEDVQKALDDVSRDGQDAGGDLERAMRDAQQDTKRLERETDELRQTIRQAGRSSRDMGRDFDRGLDDADGAVRGFKDEAIQNFSEVASSFDGSIGGAVDGIQGTLGGLATAISGPVGLALGGLGLIAGTVAAAWATKAEEIAENWRTMYDDMVESGVNFLSQDIINQKIQEIVADQGKLNAAIDEGRTAGADYRDVIRAQAGDMEALTGVLASARDRLAEQNAAQDEFIRKNGDESAAIADKQGELELLVAKYERMIGAQDSAAKAAEAARTAMERSTAANHRTADSLDRVSSSAAGVPGGKTVVVTADTRDFYAQMERIRRTRFSTAVDVTTYYGNQHRGTFTP